MYLSLSLSFSVSLSLYFSVSPSLCLPISPCLHLSLYVCIYIYIYVHIHMGYALHISIYSHVCVYVGKTMHYCCCLCFYCLDNQLLHWLLFTLTLTLLLKLIPTVIITRFLSWPRLGAWSIKAASFEAFHPLKPRPLCILVGIHSKDPFMEKLFATASNAC